MIYTVVVFKGAYYFVNVNIHPDSISSFCRRLFVLAEFQTVFVSTVPNSPLGPALGSSESQVLPSGDLLVVDAGFPFGCSDWLHFGPTCLKPIKVPFSPPICSECCVAGSVAKMTPTWMLHTGFGCCCLIELGPGC